LYAIGVAKLRLAPNSTASQELYLQTGQNAERSAAYEVEDLRTWYAQIVDFK